MELKSTLFWRQSKRFKYCDNQRKVLFAVASQLQFFSRAQKSRCGIAFPLLLNGCKRREKKKLSVSRFTFSEYLRGCCSFICYLSVMGWCCSNLSLTALLAELVVFWQHSDKKKSKDCLEIHTCTCETLTLFGGQRVFFFCLCLLQLCLVETGDFSHVRLVRHFGCERRERYLSTQVWPFLSAIVLIMQLQLNSRLGA